MEFSILVQKKQVGHVVFIFKRKLQFGSRTITRELILVNEVRKQREIAVRSPQTMVPHSVVDGANRTGFRKSLCNELLFRMERMELLGGLLAAEQQEANVGGQEHHVRIQESTAHTHTQIMRVRLKG